MKKKAAQSAKLLPDFEVLPPYTKMVFGKMVETNQFPIGKPAPTGDGYLIPAVVTGKDNAELLCLGIEAAKLLQKFAANPAICKSVANQNVKLKAEIHRIIDRLAELGFATPNESYVPKENRDIKIE